MKRFVKGNGRCEIFFDAVATQEGIGVILTGGEKKHIGGNVLAVPRVSLTGDGQSCDLYITPVPGHKDTDVAVLVAAYLCKKFVVPVSVTAGIHSDDISKEEIAEILKNSMCAAGEYAKILEEKNSLDRNERKGAGFE